MSASRGPQALKVYLNANNATYITVPVSGKTTVSKVHATVLRKLVARGQVSRGSLARAEIVVVRDVLDKQGMRMETYELFTLPPSAIILSSLLEHAHAAGLEEEDLSGSVLMSLVSTAAASRGEETACGGDATRGAGKSRFRTKLAWESVRTLEASRHTKGSNLTRRRSLDFPHRRWAQPQQEHEGNGPGQRHAVPPHHGSCQRGGYATAKQRERRGGRCNEEAHLEQRARQRR